MKSRDCPIFVQILPDLFSTKLSFPSFLLKKKRIELERSKNAERLVDYFSPTLLIIICGIVTCNNTGSALTRWFGFQNGNRFCCRNADTLYVHIYIYREAAAQMGYTIYRHNFDRWILIIAKNERVTELPPPMYNRWILWANWEREKLTTPEQKIKSNFIYKINLYLRIIFIKFFQQIYIYIF